MDSSSIQKRSIWQSTFWNYAGYALFVAFLLLSDADVGGAFWLFGALAMALLLGYRSWHLRSRRGDAS
jgi:4-hydroxybenzoate polyprenyltransferase